MEQYGFIPQFPIIVVRRHDGKLIVKDGQGRLKMAEFLDQPVFFTVADEFDFSIARINATTRLWKQQDFLEVYARRGAKHYVALQEFMAETGLPIGVCVRLLFANPFGTSIADDAFKAGVFEARDSPLARKVARIMAAVRTIKPRQPVTYSTKFIEAVIRCCLVENFDDERFCEKITAYPYLIEPKAKLADHVRQCEAIYNFRVPREKRLNLLFEVSIALSRQASERRKGKARLRLSKERSSVEGS